MPTSRSATSHESVLRIRRHWPRRGGPLSHGERSRRSERPQDQLREPGFRKRCRRNCCAVAWRRPARPPVGRTVVMVWQPSARDTNVCVAVIWMAILAAAGAARLTASAENIRLATASPKKQGCARVKITVNQRTGLQAQRRDARGNERGRSGRRKLPVRCIQVNRLGRRSVHSSGGTPMPLATVDGRLKEILL
jgi:hypothetical protein